MEYRHVCGFCDWWREASGPTMLAPHCARCGCVLEAMAPGELPAPVIPPLAGLPRRTAATVALLGALALVAFAAKTGEAFAGTTGAIAAALCTALAAFIVASPSGTVR